MTDGEQIAREAAAYLAAVDTCTAEGYDPHAAGRAVKPPPLDVETVYSEGAYVARERGRTADLPEAVPCCQRCGSPSPWPIAKCWRCIGGFV